MMHEIKMTPRGETHKAENERFSEQSRTTIQSGDSAFSSSTVFSVESSSYVF